MRSRRLFRNLHLLALEHKNKWPYLGAGLICLVIYAFSHSKESTVLVYKNERGSDFKDARILGSRGDSIYEGKEKLLNKSVRDLMAAQAALRESNEKLLAKVEALEKGAGNQGPPGATPSPSASPGTSPETQPSSSPVSDSQDGVRVGPPSEQFTATHGTSVSRPSAYGAHYSQRRSHSSSNAYSSRGNTIISFPVKDVPSEKTEGITLPAGSYVKAKLMTGVEAPEGKTYPVLLQLDYAYIIPNQKRVDLSGCFMIAKSQGDLSTERVQMQASKLSCVSKEGRMFEREVNGFIADDKDNSFAVMGSVNSKQDRVAAMAFLSSVVEGVGKSIQQAQTTQQTTPLGGSQAILTGNQGAYLAAGGASNAANLVTQWYLKQAQNLLPTINIGSGQDVWVVMQDSVKLPNDYFKKNSKGGASEGVYTYFSRIVD